MKVLNKILALIAIFVLASFLLPIIKIGQTTSIKPDDIFLWIFTLVMLPLIWHKAARFPIIRVYAILFVFIVLSTIISEQFAARYYTDAIRLPTSFLRILSKLSAFTLFLYVSYYQCLKKERLINMVSIVFILAMVFGIMQYFNLFNARNFANTYFLGDEGVQSYNFLSFNRIIGTAPAIISWAGCSLLMFHFFLFIAQKRFIVIVGSVLAVLNIFMAASRAGIIALFASLLIIEMIRAIVIKKSVVRLIYALCIFFFFSLGAYFTMENFMPDQVEFLMSRFDKAEEAITVSGRGAQLDFYFNLLEDDPLNYVFGVGISTIKDYGYLEIDAAYILVGFGMLGFILHYLLIYYLLRFAYKNRNLNSQFFLFVWGSTIAYLIFSLGFFFIYELYMGAAYWWLNGMMIGLIYKIKHVTEGKYPL